MDHPYNNPIVCGGTAMVFLTSEIKDFKSKYSENNILVGKKSTFDRMKSLCSIMSGLRYSNPSHIPVEVKNISGYDSMYDKNPLVTYFMGADDNFFYSNEFFAPSKLMEENNLAENSKVFVKPVVPKFLSKNFQDLC